MPDWNPEIRRRLASLQLAPAREAATIEELAQCLEDCYIDILEIFPLSDLEIYVMR